MNKTDTDSGKQPEDDLYPGKQYQNLFNYVANELQVSLLQSEMDEIISIVHKDFSSGEQGVQYEMWGKIGDIMVNGQEDPQGTIAELSKQYLLIKK